MDLKTLNILFKHPTFHQSHHSLHSNLIFTHWKIQASGENKLIHKVLFSLITQTCLTQFVWQKPYRILMLLDGLEQSIFCTNIIISPSPHVSVLTFTFFRSPNQQSSKNLSASRRRGIILTPACPSTGFEEVCTGRNLRFCKYSPTCFVNFHR